MPLSHLVSSAFLPTPSNELVLLADIDVFSLPPSGGEVNNRPARSSPPRTAGWREHCRVEHHLGRISKLWKDVGGQDESLALRVSEFVAT